MTIRLSHDLKQLYFYIMDVLFPTKCEKVKDIPPLIYGSMIRRNIALSRTYRDIESCRAAIDHLQDRYPDMPNTACAIAKALRSMADRRLYVIITTNPSINN
jgi:hypothetical protein